jgi:four helix bundle protein
MDETGNLNERLFNFAVRSINFLKKLPNTPEFKTIRYQYSKCSCSSGANYEESQAGSSRADFNNKVRISLREMRESNYWLRLVKATLPELREDTELNWLLTESGELKRILGSIVSKTNR